MPDFNPEKLVFIDESGFDTKMPQRCGHRTPGMATANKTFIAGLRIDRIAGVIPISVCTGFKLAGDMIITSPRTPTPLRGRLL